MKKPSRTARKTRTSLARYQEKRDFTQTAEPSGRLAVAPSSRRRFVVQKHAASHLHYDFRLELDGVFKSWAVAKGPSIDPGVKRLAVEVEDHPLDYGDFEGTIPKGQYGGGTVQLWDRGYWVPENDKGPEEGLAGGDFKFRLDGERLQGSWVLVRLKGDRFGGKRVNWLLIKHRDASARPGDAEALLDVDRSVASGRSMAQIESGKGKPPTPFMLATERVGADAVWQSNRQDKSRSVLKTAETATLRSLPTFIEPQLCKLVDRPPAVAGWAHEVKLDGYRTQLRVHDGGARLRTRSGLDWTEQFAAIAGIAEHFPDCIIDGEVCALAHDRMPSFAALQAALSENRSEDLVFFAFDLLAEGREDLRPLPLGVRKQRLKALLEHADPGDSIRYVAHFESTADTVLSSACEMNLEGIVSKRLDAPYVSGRSGGWTKAKCRAGHEVVLGGWTTEAGQLRSLLAGVHRDGHLAYVGRIGTGYGAAVAGKLLPTLKQLTRPQSPFGGKNAPPKERNVRWLDPELVAEIEFAGWTATGMIRQASFKGLRRDKPASDVVAELPSPVAAVEDSQPVSPAARSPSRNAGARSGKAAASRAMAPRKPAASKTSAVASKATAPTKPSASKASAVASKATAPRKPSASKTSATAAQATAPASRAPAARTPTPASKGPPVVMGVTLSHPDKVLWPKTDDEAAVTKRDLAQYYEAVGPWMLPHVQGRPCSLLRAPDGIHGEQFFQRHAMAGISDLFTLVKVKGDKAPYVQIDRVETLAAVAQIGALEVHAWNCAEGDPEVAGRLVFDLDPAPDVKFAAVIAAALEVRDRLRKVGLECFCKTTGGKGLHVVTPLEGGEATVRWPAAKDFAHVICAQMAQDSPSKYLDTMAKKDRVGRIFLDYLRNDKTATAVAVLSPRARAGAAISMPIHWKDVKAGLDPSRYTLRTGPAVLEKSKPWADYARAARSLTEAIRRITA